MRLYLCYLKLVSTGAGVVIGLSLRVVLKVLNLNLIVKHRHVLSLVNYRGQVVWSLLLTTEN